MLENVVINPTTGLPDYDDARYTENTRAAFPIEHMEDALPEGKGDRPQPYYFLRRMQPGFCPHFETHPAAGNVLLPFGVYQQAGGYRNGIVEPVPTFSTCFGGPFMLLKPEVYANLLGEKIKKYNVNVFGKHRLDWGPTAPVKG